jgi:hypothetical protein
MGISFFQMKKHQNRFLFSREEADYYISRLNKEEFTRTEYESKLLILNLLLHSKQVQHYRCYKRNYNLVFCKSSPIVYNIHCVIDHIKENNRNDYYSLDLYAIIDWIRAHTIRKRKENLSGPTR